MSRTPTPRLYLTPTHQITYDYLHLSPSPTSHKPTLLFLHGFPDSRHCWRHQIPFVAELGYGVIAPNLLGYGGTDKPGPDKPEQFRYKRQVESLLEVLDHEGVQKFVVVGHDWGVFPTARICNYAPERILGAVFIAGSYYPPKERMDIDAFNAHALQTVGYERQGYFYFMCQPDSGEIVKKHVDSFITLFWNKDPAIWKTHFCPTGAMQAWLEADKMGKTASWFTAEDHEYYRKSLLEGIVSQTNWYRIAFNNLSHQEELDSLPAGSEIVKAPVLLMPCEHDAAIAKEAPDYSIKFCEDVEVKWLNSGHWGPAEVPDVVNENLRKFLEERVKV